VSAFSLGEFMSTETKTEAEIEIVDKILKDTFDELKTMECSSLVIKPILLELKTEQIIKLPLDCKLLTVSIDSEGIKLYIECDSEEKFCIDRKFAIYTDKQFIHSNPNRSYIGTLHRHKAPTIHIYEI
jgi:hypothetical protein